MMAGVGDEPTSPLTTTTPAPVEPVTPELRRAPNCFAVTSGGATATTTANAGAETKRSATNPTQARSPGDLIFIHSSPDFGGGSAFVLVQGPSFIVRPGPGVCKALRRLHPVGGAIAGISSP